VTESQKQALPRIGIAGGGRGGCNLLDLFVRSHMVDVVYLVDINPDAPGLTAARQAGVSAYTDLDAALGSHKVDFVFELTGSARLAEQLARLLDGAATTLVTAGTTRLMLQVIQACQGQTTHQVTEEVTQIGRQITGSLQSVSGMLESIHKITGDMRLLAINARIEAARVGDTGRGFAVVAEAMQQSSDAVRGVTQEIEQLNADLMTALQGINASLQRLQ
jgi:hypothetical protein